MDPTEKYVLNEKNPEICNLAGIVYNIVIF